MGCQMRREDGSPFSLGEPTNKQLVLQMHIEHKTTAPKNN
jgi:hypothetical protein